MELQTFLRAIRKYWWVIAICAVLGGGGGFGYAEQATPVYASSVTFVAITHPSANTTSNPLANEQFAQQRVATYADVLSTDRLADLVSKALPQYGLDPGYLTQHITGTAKTDTTLLTATIDDTNRQRSLDIARSVSTVFPQMVDELETSGGTKEALLSLDVVDGPTTLPAPISPRTKLLIALGLVAGLVIGIALALLREVLDTTVRSSEVLRAHTDAPVLGVVVADADSGKNPLIAESRSRSIRAEAYRQLRTNLQFVDVARPASVIVVTSSMPGEGKSTTATNLAIAFAESGRTVLLVDADLRRPKIAEYLGLEGSVGLTNVLAGQVDFDDVVQPWGSRGMAVLPSGSIPPNPSELLGSQQMDDLIVDLRSRYDIVVIDTPPLLPVTDATVAAVHSDGAVVVVRHGRTRRAEVQRAVETLRAVDARVLGTILNGSPNKGADAQNRYGEYGYLPQEKEAATGRRARNRAAAVESTHRSRATTSADRGDTAPVTPTRAPGAERPGVHRDEDGAPEPETRAAAATENPDSAADVADLEGTTAATDTAGATDTEEAGTAGSDEGTDGVHRDGIAGDAQDDPVDGSAPDTGGSPSTDGPDSTEEPDSTDRSDGSDDHLGGHAASAAAVDADGSGTADGITDGSADDRTVPRGEPGGTDGEDVTPDGAGPSGTAPGAPANGAAGANGSAGGHATDGGLSAGSASGTDGGPRGSGRPSRRTR